MQPYAYRERTDLPKSVAFLKNRKLTFLLAGMCAIVLMITFSNKGLLRRFIMEKELRDKQARVEELAADIRQLERARDLLRDDPSTIEHVARESHGMIRPGEVVFRIRTAAEPSKK
jgi:cell division protein FtsB